MDFYFFKYTDKKCCMETQNLYNIEIQTINIQIYDLNHYWDVDE